ncbi:MAG: hypothetical protein J6B85_11910 [Lachnospiraceae bacterium]|nr:hypothetical protein [Lachnospiraceae bacterium]
MKMNYGSRVCEFSVAHDFTFSSCVRCYYEKDTICYAVRRFFRKSGRIRRDCTYESWQIRLAKGKSRRQHRFSYLIPAILMELPGAWIRLSGTIDARGVTVQRLEILSRYPGFEAEHSHISGKNR